MMLMKLGDTEIAGSSPETLIRLEGRTITSMPIAGTRRRGRTEKEDKALEEDLTHDAKELAEHNMLVDLARNDVGKVSEFGSVKVHDLHHVKRFSHVMHLTSRVTGRLKEGLDAIDTLCAALPAGTLSGAPKIRACEILDSLEPRRRGPYGGGIGYLDFSGNMDICITIRTAVKRGDIVYFQSGGGIVADSVTENEFQETLNKSGAVKRRTYENNGGRMMILIIDNYDSFTYNLYQAVGTLTPSVQVVRNDSLTVSEAAALQPQAIILSPGPGKPKEAGITEAVLEELKGQVPILGVCLGHQAMGEVFGGTVTLAPHLVHGKADDIKLDRSCPLFKNLPPVIKGARYHSLIVERDSLPPELLVTAETYAGEIMGLRHRDYEIYGLQFHPESIMTPMGASIIENFLRHVGALS